MFYYCSRNELSDLVDNNRLIVSWERSYEQHCFNGLTEDENDWGAGELRVEFADSLNKFVEKSGNHWYSQEPLEDVVALIRDVVQRDHKISVTVSGRLNLEGWSDVAQMYQLGISLMEWQCVAAEDRMWGEFIRFCQKNEGFIFPKDYVVEVANG